MDSLTQIALGSAVAIAVLGRRPLRAADAAVVTRAAPAAMPRPALSRRLGPRTAAWKAALWGAVCGTLPDLDAFIEHGDPIRNMTFHRAESHALFWLTLLSPLIAWLAARLHGERAAFPRWWLALWLALVTHPLLDWMTVYGTQLALPFTDRPFGTGSVFIIDPLYTVPLIIGVVAVLRGRGLRWNGVALAFSTAYLAWGLLAQQWITGIATASLREQGVDPQRILVTPTPFNTVLWRIVAVGGDDVHEGLYSFFDRERRITFERIPRGRFLYEKLHGQWPVQRIAWFTHGFFKMSERDGQVLITDLRMGQEPVYTFAFVVAQRRGEAFIPVDVQYAGGRPDVKPALAWLWRRMWGDPVPPPR